MIFVANLRSQTIEAFGQQQIQPDAYLLSSHRIDSTTLRRALELRDEGIPVFADNGTKALIDDVLDTFRQEAATISDEIRAIRRQIGHVPRGKDVPSSLRQKASELSNRVVDECTRISEAVNGDDLLASQLSMRPTHLIAQEDFAVACLIGLGLEREITGWDIRKFDRRNQRSLELFQRVNSDPRCSDIKVYAVLSAMDYNTARSAGSIAAEAGAKHIALGFAGINRDAQATDFYVLGKGSYKLSPTPRRYVRTAQIVQGLADGYRDAGVKLDSFHALGLGTPAIFPIFAAGADLVPNLTTDATSPILDAVRDQVLYDPENNGDRLSRVEIVRRIVNGGSWPPLSGCPFCPAFQDEFGHSESDSVLAWEALGRPEITLGLFETAIGLADAIPLFASPPGDVATKARDVYIIHNHFVLGQLTAEYPEGRGRRAFAMTKIDELIDGASLVVSRGLLGAMEILEELA